MTTFHGKDGKFSSKAGAHSAVRDGERLRVVRQLRRMRQSKTESGADKIARLVLRANLAKMKAGLLGELSAPGYINVADVLFDR